LSYVNGIHKAGAAEAVRVAQALIHRDLETGMIIAAGLRADRIAAQRLPEAAAGERVRGRREGEPGDRRRGRRRRGEEPPPGSGGLVDLEA
jgi:hypothetical protein